MTDIEYIRLARKLEKEGRWEEAADTWVKIRRYEDANACTLIAKSIEKGDNFRNDAIEINGKLALNLITKEEYYSQLEKLYKKHYK